MKALHAGDAGDDRADLGLVERRAVDQGGHVFADGVDADLGDEGRDHQREQRVSPGVAQPDQSKTEEHRHAHADAGQGVARIGHEHLAAQLARLVSFPQAGPGLQRCAEDQRADAPGVDDHGPRVEQTGDGAGGHFPGGDKERGRDEEGRDGFELAMAVGMFGIRRPATDAHGDDADDVGDAVKERVETVGQEAERAGGQAHDELGHARKHVEDEGDDEDVANGVVVAHGRLPAERSIHVRPL